jgi:hypothetical protein
MSFKDPQKTKEYYKKYYLNNKEKYALSKRLNYWRKKALSLGEDYKTVMAINTEEELKKLCDEHVLNK